jgi:hypothetical protein
MKAQNEPTIEGLLRSWWTWRFGRHYVVKLADLIPHPGHVTNIEGPEVRIPRENVSWVQVLS